MINNYEIRNKVNVRKVVKDEIKISGKARKPLTVKDTSQVKPSAGKR